MADPHANDPHEDPEQHIGQVIADPWEDERQTDWQTPSIPLPEVKPWPGS